MYQNVHDLIKKVKNNNYYNKSAYIRFAIDDSFAKIFH